jgi:methyltransferase (TIGR00027 family)
MKPGRASRTALKVAIRRAAHMLMEQPPVLDDPIALPLVGQGHARDMERAMHPVGRDFRAFMAARSRHAEEKLAEAVGRGDTFAYRNPFPALRVFEVDFPATQEWKRVMLVEAKILLPANLTFVPLDFEHKTLADGLAEAGFDANSAACFSWLGVVPYLTLEAFR